MLAALAGVALNSPGYLVAAFNPVTLNLSMIALSIIALVLLPYSATAKTCHRRKPEQEQ
jgi:peptidoglycan biosynthesis protein MviN/MurJ (putative lipid II flippase)